MRHVLQIIIIIHYCHYFHYFHYCYYYHYFHHRYITLVIVTVTHISFVFCSIFADADELLQVSSTANENAELVIKAMHESASTPQSAPPGKDSQTHSLCSTW